MECWVCGVVTASVLLLDIGKLYDNVGIDFDQATLRAALWWASVNRGLRIWVLPPEYNLRTPKPWLTGAGMAVKIVHGRVSEDKRELLHGYLNQNISEFGKQFFPNRSKPTGPSISPRSLGRT